MTEKKREAEGGPTDRVPCEVCNRARLPKGWDLDRDGEFDNFCTRHLYGNDDVPPAAVCYRIGYERRTRQVDESIANAARAIAALELEVR